MSDQESSNQSWFKKYYSATPEEKQQRSSDSIFIPAILSMYEKADLSQFSIVDLVEISDLVQKALEVIRQAKQAKQDKNMGLDSFAMPMFQLHRRVLKTIQSRTLEENVEKIASSAQVESKEDLKAQIEKLIETSSEWQSKFLGIEQERKQLQEQIEKKIAEREAFKERWAIWRSFLEKESVSTILGAFLLLIIVVCLIITTFTHATTPQILNDGFLVLLGYFFGQTAANAIKKDKDE